jgi:putative ABC transport system substrate-binding protein
MSYGLTHCARSVFMAEKFSREPSPPIFLPVQQSVKVEFVLNLKTAKTLGLTVPTALVTTADEIIE